ncbi:1667_t:CDS:1, partial [Funneliformis mosseae]
ITNAEERNKKARLKLIITYYHYGEELKKRLVHYREEYKEHEVLKKLYDEVKDQLPKEVTKNAIRKKSNRARK